jgi:hypothetical protein
MWQIGRRPDRFYCAALHKRRSGVDREVTGADRRQIEILRHNQKFSRATFVHDHRLQHRCRCRAKVAE